MMNRELNEEFFIEAENNIKDRLTEIDNKIQKIRIK